MRSFTREKKIYCGENYLEVDIFPYTDSQQQAVRGKRRKRSRRETVTEPKQRNLNDKNARRYFIQLINTNFGENDLHVTLTYNDKFLPDTVEDSEKEISNFLRRVSYKRKKQGLEPLKYVLVTECKVKKGSDKIRMHHHIIMNGGLDRDEIEGLWSRRKLKGQKKGERIGFVNADRLQLDDDSNGIAALGNYLSKDPKGRKRWNCSQNLKKPWSRTNDCRYRNREVEKIAKNPPGRDYWEKRYPGWTIANNDYSYESKYNEETGWSIYLKLCRRN